MGDLWWPTNSRKIFALDVERTDSSSHHRLTQIGIVGNISEHPISLVIDPETNTGKPPYEIAGIEVDLAGGRTPKPFAYYADELYKLMDNATIIVQNDAANGDIASIRNEFVRCGKEPPTPDRVIDTLWFMRLVKQPGKRTLTAGCNALNIPPPEPAHNARADALATWRLFIGLCNRHPEVRSYYYAEEMVCCSRYFLEHREPWITHARLSPVAAPAPALLPSPLLQQSKKEEVRLPSDVVDSSVVEQFIESSGKCVRDVRAVTTLSKFRESVLRWSGLPRPPKWGDHETPLRRCYNIVICSMCSTCGNPASVVGCGAHYDPRKRKKITSIRGLRLV
jgi:DNA polymerase III epsilon subunit-like protein